MRSTAGDPGAVWSFDRAAGYYDATRSLPPTVRDALIDQLAGELAGRGLCLEIGVGTGRIAIPLRRRVTQMIGTDIAPSMLERLLDNAGDPPGIALALADATGLPVSDDSIGAVLASHVLHLVPDWRAAVDEAVRVLRTDGVLLVDFGGHPEAPWSAATEELFHRRGIVRLRPGVSDADSVARHLGSRAAVRPLPPLRFAVVRSLSQDLADWEAQIHSWTWAYPSDRMRTACGDIRRWAAGGDWPLERPVRLERTVRWWAFDRTG